MLKIEYIYISITVTIIFLSEWGYSVYIEISLRLISPAPTFRALKKYERTDVTFSHALK